MGAAKMIGYAALGAITAPVWVPLAFIGYVGYKAARFAFRNPKTTLASIGLAGLMWYAGCERISQKVDAGLLSLQQGYQQHQATKRLEERLQQEQQGRGLAEQAFSEQQKQLQRLEQQLKRYESAAQPAASPKAPAKLEAIADQQFFFYYVKLDDTLEHISKKVHGDDSMAALLAHDNGIQDPRKLLTGQLLKVRKSMVLKNNPDVYEQVPKLASVVLPGNITITQACKSDQRCISMVFEVNRKLGLQYMDTFPYRKGARIVYYR
jgi:hypothetical protein